MSRVWGHPSCVRSLVYRQTTKPRQSARDLLSWEFITVEQRKVDSYFRFCQGLGEEQKSRAWKERSDLLRWPWGDRLWDEG